MTKYSTNTNNDNNPSTSCCFATIFKRFICTGNLPTHPSPPDTNQKSLEKPINKIHSSSLTNNNVEDYHVNVIKSRVQTQASFSPGIIARLMGLETLPNYEKSTTLDSLFRSKSLNSLHFLPDFDPTRAAFHRRARTSASFHEQGHKFLVKIDENLESDGLLFVQESKVMGNECRNPRKKEGVLKEKNRQNGSRNRRKVSYESKKKYEECYTSGATSTISCSRRSRSLKKHVNNSCKLNEREKCVAMHKRRLIDNNNKVNKVSSEIVNKKKIIGRNRVMCIEAHQSDSKLLSKTPVSVDHHKEVYKGEGGQISSLRRKSTPKIKFRDNLPQDIPKSKQNEDRCTRMARDHELVKDEGKVADYVILENLGYVCNLAEEHIIRETNWAANYNSFKLLFVEEFSLHLGQEILDLLLDELLHDIMIMIL